MTRMVLCFYVVLCRGENAEFAHSQAEGGGVDSFAFWIAHGFADFH